MNTMKYEKKKHKDTISYGLTWSDYIEGTKFNVLQKMTEMTGIYVVFYLNKYKRLAPCVVGGAWFTGLRPTLLKLFSRLPSDVLPNHIFTKIQSEKIFIKYLEIYDLNDFTDILYSIKDKYPQAFFDSNGLPVSEHSENVKTIDINTKIYYKEKADLDI